MLMRFKFIIHYLKKTKEDPKQLFPFKVKTLKEIGLTKKKLKPFLPIIMPKHSFFNNFLMHVSLL